MSCTAAARRANHHHELSAFGVHVGLMRATEAAGWPVEYETSPEYASFGRGQPGLMRRG